MVAATGPITILSRLVAKEADFEYVVYVFEVLDAQFEDKYIMCTRYPNWNHRNIEIGEEGYLEFSFHRAGFDKWFDGTRMVPYLYTGIQFLKFIEKPKEVTNKYTI
jgi:hypothetical protein